MSARRWFILLGFVLISLVLSLGWFVWAVFNAPPGQRMGAVGITGILQLLELPLAYGLLRLSDYAHTWAVRLNLVKIAGAVGLSIAGAIGNQAELVAAGIAACGFFVAYTLFLRRNSAFFD